MNSNFAGSISSNCNLFDDLKLYCKSFNEADLVTFHCCDIIPDRNNLKEERFILA
jgi:hypothetical protein